MEDTPNKAYSAHAIARFFIKKSEEDKQPLTPMQLIKLVYIAHGWHLGIFGKPLLNEEVQAWKYGPVIESLYRTYKHFKDGKIPYEEGSAAPGPEVEITKNTTALLDRVWENYGHLSGLQLSTLTHQSGTPWHQTWHQDGGKEEIGAIIPECLIADFYKEKAVPNSSDGH